MQLQTHVRREGQLPASFPPPVGTVSTWGWPVCQRDGEILPPLLSLCLVLLSDTSQELTHTLFKYTKIQLAMQNCTVTHPQTQEKNCACQQYMNFTSYFLKEASLLNSCWWPQDKLFNACMCLSHPDLYKAVISVLKEWTNSKCAILFTL